MMSSSHIQQGDVLLMALFSLLLMSSTLFVSVHNVKNDATTAGALGWHTRGKQASEVALKQIMSEIDTAFSNGNSASQAWNKTKPTDWSSCNATPKPCGFQSITLSNTSFNVYWVGHSKTTLTGAGNPCSPKTANYLQILLHAVEASGKGAQVDTEAIYRVCQ